MVKSELVHLEKRFLDENYTVKALKNRITPQIGSSVSKKAAKELIDSVAANVEVRITIKK